MIEEKEIDLDNPIFAYYINKFITEAKDFCVFFGVQYKKKRDLFGLSFYIKTFIDFTTSIHLSKSILDKPSQFSV